MNPHHHEDHDIVSMHAGTAREPASTALVVFIMGTMFFSGLFLFSNSGGFQSSVYNADAVSWSGEGGGDAKSADPMILGKSVFMRNCALCHQATGLGAAGQFPPLAGSEWVLAKDWHGDNHIVRIVLNGLHGPVTVKGQPFDSAMAAWGTVLKDEQIAAVLTYIRNEWGNKAPPISTEFVARIREENKDRRDAWTQAELKAIPREMDEAKPAAEPEAAPKQEEKPR